MCNGTAGIQVIGKTEEDCIVKMRSKIAKLDKNAVQKRKWQTNQASSFKDFTEEDIQRWAKSGNAFEYVQ